MSCSISLTHQKKVRGAGAFLRSTLLSIFRNRYIKKDTLYLFRHLPEFRNAGFLVSTKPWCLLKDKIQAGTYHFVGKDVSVKCYSIEKAIPAEQQRCANCNSQRHIVSKQSSVARTSYIDGLKVRTWCKNFDPISTFAHREFQR